MSKETGGPAFPTHYTNGMTLRDYFAAKAMEAFISKIGWNSLTSAGNAYAIADEMLKEREIER